MQTPFDEDQIKTEYIGNQETGQEKDHADGKSHAGGKEPRRCPWCFRPVSLDSEKCPHCGYYPGAAQSANYYLEPGTVIYDRYVIGMVVGAGGFGITYKAWDRQLSHERAVKEYFNTALVHRNPGTKEVLPNSEGKKAQISEELDRFLTEARYTSQFRNDPNFVEVYDFFEENGTAYMVMDFLEGKTLEDVILRQGKVAPEEAVRIFSELSAALGKLHENGIIHRDVSPDNVFVLNDGRVKLMDLGAASFPKGAGSYKAVILKPGMAPPEQYVDDTVADKRIDVYALSATMYWALTGVKPVESTNRLGEDPLKKPSDVVPEIPRKLNNLILRGMSVHPELRFKNMQEFRKALLGKKDVADSRGEVKKRKSMRLFLIILSAVVIVAGATLLFLRFSSLRSNALLNDTELEVWVPCEEDPQSALAVVQNMTGEFVNDYPHVSVVLKAVPISEYSAKVQEALSSAGSTLTLFQYEAAGEPEKESLYPLTSLLEETDRTSYRHLSGYEDAEKIPLGFKALCVYESTVTDAEGATGDITEFLNGRSRLYAGDSADFGIIQEKMPGCYQVHPLKEEYRAECLTDLWCVNEAADEYRKIAAMRLLSYWLGEKGQDALHVQNREAMPLNKEVLQVYLDVNAELGNVAGSEEPELLCEEDFDQRKAELISREDLNECID